MSDAVGAPGAGREGVVAREVSRIYGRQRALGRTTIQLAGHEAVAPTMVGVWIGQAAQRRLSAEMFRKAFIFGMLGIGLHMARSLL